MIQKSGQLASQKASFTCLLHPAQGKSRRRRRMRAWTVVVLSDYGADRWAFQNAEVLLMPEIGEITIPLRNSHVLRMQGAYFLLDWIGRGWDRVVRLIT